MPATLKLEIVKGTMPRHGLLNKPLQLFVDETPIAWLDWGNKKTFEIPAGGHALLMRTRQGWNSGTLNYTLAVGGNAGGALLPGYQRPPAAFLRPPGCRPAGKPEEQKRRGSGWNCGHDVRLCRGCLFSFFVNILTGYLPGGFLGGAIGGGIGAAVGMSG